MKFLVTGAAGFIGFHVSKRLCEEGHDVFGLDSLNDYYDVNLKLARLSELGKYTADKNHNKYGTFKFIKLDLTDRESIASLFETDSWSFNYS